jgi:rRNA maturation RNase YbeY
MPLKNELSADILINFSDWKKHPRLKELINLNKKFEEHITHLIIHGTLHLCGFDHDNDKNAVTMENIERHIMGELGYNDPYEII